LHYSSYLSASLVKARDRKERHWSKWALIILLPNATQRALISGKSKAPAKQDYPVVLHAKAAKSE
jgi:hypothetical protein